MEHDSFDIDDEDDSLDGFYAIGSIVSHGETCKDWTCLTQAANLCSHFDFTHIRNAIDFYHECRKNPGWAFHAFMNDRSIKSVVDEMKKRKGTKSCT